MPSKTGTERELGPIQGVACKGLCVGGRNREGGGSGEGWVRCWGYRGGSGGRVLDCGCELSPDQNPNKNHWDKTELALFFRLNFFRFAEISRFILSAAGGTV
jgi:hypothetical protein